MNIEGRGFSFPARVLSIVSTRSLRAAHIDLARNLLPDRIRPASGLGVKLLKLIAGPDFTNESRMGRRHIDLIRAVALRGFQLEDLGQL